MWIKDARELGKSDIQIIVIGNKTDLYDQRIVMHPPIQEVPTSEAVKYCKSKGVAFVETSAITGENVEWAMQLLSQKLLERIDRGLLDRDPLKPKFQIVKKDLEPPAQKPQC